MENANKFGADFLERMEERYRERRELEAKAPKCPVCNGPVLDGGCDLCAERAEQKRRKQEQDAAQRALDIRRLGGERAYREFTLEGYKNKHVIDLCNSYPAKNLYIWGSPGVGKTHLATALVRQYQDARVVKPQDIFWDCRAAKTVEEERAVVHRFVKTGHLVIDDLGIAKNTEFNSSILYLILDGRDMAERSGLIITSNLSPGALCARLDDDRLPSRIFGRGTIAIDLMGEDGRLYSNNKPTGKKLEL